MLAKTVVLSLSLVLAAAGFLFGQAGTAVITGTVTDPTGAAIQGARVEVRDPLTSFSRETVTDEAGNYNLPRLRPSTYGITVEATGFRRYYQPDFRLEVGQSVPVDLRLEIGQVTEQIEVRGAAQLLSTEHATVGAVIDRKKILDLPLNGRNFVSLALLLPGVNTGQPGAGVGGGISIGGTRSEQNAFQLDSASMTSARKSCRTAKPRSFATSRVMDAWRWSATASMMRLRSRRPTSGSLWGAVRTSRSSRPTSSLSATGSRQCSPRATLAGAATGD